MADNNSCGCGGNTTLIFPCSGASNVGQLSNNLGVALSKKGIGKMSCLAGVGGDISGFVVSAKDCDFLVAIDGCGVKCTKACFDRHEIKPHLHLILTDEGFKKVSGADSNDEEISRAVKLAEDRISSLRPKCK